MSMTPNNPFDGNQPDQGYAQAPSKKGSNVWIWVLGILGGVVVIGALVCCGGAYMAYRAGTGVMAEAFKDQLDGNPVIDEHIGQIESLEFSFSGTTKAAEQTQGTIAFDIKGSKGSGTILIKQDPGGGGNMGIASAELKMSDGSTYAVPIEDSEMAADVVEELEIDLGEAEVIQDLEVTREVDEAIEEAEKQLKNTEAALEEAATDQ